MALPFPPPASLDSSFTMSRPTEADIDTLAQLYYEAFWLNKACTWWWPPEAEAMIEWLGVRVANKMANRGVRHFQVLDNTNPSSKELVAFSRWDIPDGYEHKFGEWIGKDTAPDVSRNLVDEKGNVEEGEEKGTVAAAGVEEAVPAAPMTIEPPRGADSELCRHFFSKSAAASKKWNSSEMLGLSLLCASPKYARRGAAKALLLPMLAIADEVGLRTYVEATPAGYPVYEKLGFRPVDVIEFDIVALTGSKWYGNEVDKLTVMIREPQPRQS